MTSFRDIFVTATYLKKSSRQKSLASREKHFSDSGLPQSAHWTHFECQALSRTFNKKRSVIGLLQPAHSCIFLYSPSLLNGVAREISFQKNHRSFQVVVTISMCHCRLGPDLAGCRCFDEYAMFLDRYRHPTMQEPNCRRFAKQLNIIICNLRDDLRDTRARCQCKRAMFIRGQLVVCESRYYDRTVTIARLGDIVNRRPVGFGWRQL